jgi:WD40 repeat protein
MLLLPAAVTGLDMCVRRPLVATCSSDHTVRLWNYADRTCDLSKWFAEEAHSIAIHPTGLMVREQLRPSKNAHQQLLACHDIYDILAREV